MRLSEGSGEMPEKWRRGKKKKTGGDRRNSEGCVGPVALFCRVEGLLEGEQTVDWKTEREGGKTEKGRMSTNKNLTISSGPGLKF